MHIRTKFDGGKQINRSQSGSWQARCSGAGLRYNEGPAWGPAAWEQVTGESANQVFTGVAEAKSKQATSDRERKSTSQAKQSRQLSKCKASDNSLQSRRDYSRYDGGRNADDITSDLPMEYLQDQMLSYYKAHVVVSEEGASEVQKMTQKQGSDDNSSSIWLAERRKRITSTNTGRIAKRRPKTKVASTVKDMLYSTFRGTAATRWGILQEPPTQAAYLSQRRIESPLVTISATGLTVSVKNPWLAASPDGLVCDPGVADPNGIAEYKNPYSARDMTMVEAVEKIKDFCLKKCENGTLTLKPSHHYYFQVQATMFCTQLTWCDFVVRTTKDICIERIPWNRTFWDEVFPKLKLFYFNAILP